MAQGISVIKMLKDAVRNMQHVGGQKDQKKLIDPKDVIDLGKDIDVQQQKIAGEKAAAQSGIAGENSKEASGNKDNKKTSKTKNGQIKDDKDKRERPADIDGAYLHDPRLREAMGQRQQQPQDPTLQLAKMAKDQQEQQNIMQSIIQMQADAQKWWAGIIRILRDAATEVYALLQGAIMNQYEVMSKVSAAWSKVILGKD